MMRIVQYDPVAGAPTMQVVSKREEVYGPSMSSPRLAFSAGDTLEINPGSFGCSIAGLGCESDVTALRQRVAERGGDPPVLSFAREGDVWTPRDSLTQTVATVSFHVHDAISAHAAFGYVPAQSLLAYVHPTLAGWYSLGLPLFDNASYTQPLDGLLVLPSRRDSGLGASVNRGVLFHEYHHRVFAHHMYRGNLVRLLASGVVDDPGALARNRLQALDEGVADFFGAYGAGNANYLAWSFDAAEAERRRLDVPRVFLAEWLDGELPRYDVARGDPRLYDPYAPGAVFAAFLWSLQSWMTLDAIATCWMQTEARLGEQLDGRLHAFEFVTPLRMLMALIETQHPEALAPACGLLRERFAAVYSRVTECNI